jgi:hypothetical protein
MGCQIRLFDSPHQYNSSNSGLFAKATDLGFFFIQSDFPGNLASHVTYPTLTTLQEVLCAHVAAGDVLDRGRSHSCPLRTWAKDMVRKISCS